MNKEAYECAMQKIENRLDGEWKNHNWRNMSNEEVDQDVMRSIELMDTLVEKVPYFNELEQRIDRQYKLLKQIGEKYDISEFLGGNAYKKAETK